MKNVSRKIGLMLIVNSLALILSIVAFFQYAALKNTGINNFKTTQSFVSNNSDGNYDLLLQSNAITVNSLSAIVKLLQVVICLFAGNVIFQYVIYNDARRSMQMPCSVPDGLNSAKSDF